MSVIRASVVRPTSALPNPVGAYGERAGAHVSLPNPVGVIRASVVEMAPCIMYVDTHQRCTEGHTHM